MNLASQEGQDVEEPCVGVDEPSGELSGGGPPVGTGRSGFVHDPFLHPTAQMSKLHAGAVIRIS